jgi:hypothetical protein
MNKRSRKSQKSQSKLAELVVVACAESMDEAKDYQILLQNNDIPAIIKRQQDELSGGKYFVVMAPEEMADEAHVIIESQDSYDDFYDSQIDETDEDEDDLDADFFED